MDPLSCLAIAGAVVQFVDFGSKLISEAHSIYKDGESTVRKKGVEAAQELQDFSTRFAHAFSEGNSGVTVTDDELALQSLCARCKSLSDSMIAKLDTLKLLERHRVWSSLGGALVNIWSKNEIMAMKERLDDYRSAIDTRIISLIRTTVNSIAIQQTTRFKELNRETQKIVLGLSDFRSSLEREQRAQAMAIAQLLNRQEMVIKAHSELVTRPLLNTNLTVRPTSCSNIDSSQAMQSEEQDLQQAVATDILKTLHFPAIEERFDEVSEAHRETFEWIFEHPTDDPRKREWDDFVEWLERDDGLYWINGKAGSGKSTLLKYIFNHPATREHLEIWKEGMDLYIATFFFWSNGTSLQKSQIGLLRSLLHDILYQIPTLIPTLFPSQWAELYLRKTRLPDSSMDISWSLSTLMNVFETLLVQKVVPMKLCLFIDALDEYSGLPSAVAKIFQNVTSVSHVKVCVSSRPLSVFLEKFKNQPQLRLPDLTRDDIQQYVIDLLENDENFQSRAARDPEPAGQLVNDIVNSASGVFLWVKLVVMDLLRGLENHDRISQLQERLKRLPTGLEALYEHMVLGVDELYREEASRFYQLVAATAEKKYDWMPVLPLDILTLTLTEDENSDLVFRAPLNFWPPLEIQNRILETDFRIRCCCGGLLETQFGKSSSRQVLSGMRVSYIHRTVKDYLDKRTITDFFPSRALGPSSLFNPSVALMKAYTLQLKLLEAVPTNTKIAQTLIDCIISYARRAEAELSEPAVALVEASLETADTWWRSVEGNPLLPKGESTITLAAQCGLHRFLNAKLDAMPNAMDRRGNRPLLDYVLNPLCSFEPFEPRTLVSASKPTLMVLLERGASPNEKWMRRNTNCQTPWQNALTCLSREPFRFLGSEDKEYVFSRWADILKTLLQHGADATTDCQAPKMIMDKDGKRQWIETRLPVVEVINMIFANNPSLRDEIAIYVLGMAPEIISNDRSG